MPSRCYIVPPHLLRGIAESAHNPERIRAAARASLTGHDRFIGARKTSLTAAINNTRGPGAGAQKRQSIVPPHLLRQVAQSGDVDEATRKNSQATLEHTEQIISHYRGSHQCKSPRLYPTFLFVTDSPSSWIFRATASCFERRRHAVAQDKSRALCL